MWLYRIDGIRSLSIFKYAEFGNVNVTCNSLQWLYCAKCTQDPTVVIEKKVVNFEK
jgi:hypothetical protein